MQQRYGSMWVSAVGEPGPTLEDLQQHIDEWTELGWYVVGYSTNRVEDGSVLHNFIWRKDEKGESL
jgi:hypothetical protein